MKAKQKLNVMYTFCTQVTTSLGYRSKGKKKEVKTTWLINEINYLSVVVYKISYWNWSYAFETFNLIYLQRKSSSCGVYRKNNSFKINIMKAPTLSSCTMSADLKV